MNKIYGKSICVIAPHPDDEVLGVGGTIAKATNNGIKVNLLIVSGHLPPLYNEDAFVKTKNECLKSSEILKIEKVDFLKIPATYIHKEPISKLNNEIKIFIDSCKADTVFIPFPDRHVDHRLIFEASMVATRPTGEFWPKLILSYETLSETDWNAPYIEPNFRPEWFENISDFLDLKLKALKCYQSQIHNNESRNEEAVKALARYRGSQNGFGFAESFKLIRCLN